MRLLCERVVRWVWRIHGLHGVENLANVSTRCSGLLQREEALKKTRASGRKVGKVFNPVVKLVLENQPFLMPEPAEKPSLHSWIEL